MILVLCAFGQLISFFSLNPDVRCGGIVISLQSLWFIFEGSLFCIVELMVRI